MEDVRSQEGLIHAGQADAAPQQQPSVQQQQQQGQAQDYQQCRELLEQKDAEIELLQKKLEHYRSWLSSLQGQMQHKDPQVIKNARRLYIGGVPEGAREAELRAFFDGIMNSTGASCGPGSSIVTCKISSDKSYAFLEMRSVEEASNAMAFDGVVFRDTNLKIRRPSNYSPADAVGLGPVTPDPTIDTSGLTMCKTVVEDTWNKIFIGGLPCHYTDDQVKELLAPYGALKSFNLVMDKNTGKSKGYAFCEFADPNSIGNVINGLHMQTFERKVLTVKRALEGMRQGGGGRMSGTPLGEQTTGPMGEPSSSGSSRGGAMHPPPPPGAGLPPMRSGSYGSSTHMQAGHRMPGRAGSGNASPMHGGHRYSPHHPHGHPMGSPGSGGDPFGGGHHMMGPGPHGGYGVGYYVPGDAAAAGMYGPGMVPGPGGPLHGWPTHGAFGPGPGNARPHRGGQQQQAAGFGSGSWGGQQQQQQQQRGSSSYMGSGPGGRGPHGSGPRGGPGGPGASQTPGTPSPVPPTPGAAPDNRSSVLSPGIGGGAATAAAALAGAAAAAAGRESEGPPVGHSSSGTGSSLYPQHSSSGTGSSTVRQRPSDAGSTADPTH